MPPIVPRKRLRQSPEPQSKKPKLNGKPLQAVSRPNDRRKVTLYDDLDATVTNQSSRDGLASLQDDEDESESSLTSLSDGEFEDVPVPKSKAARTRGKDDEDEDEDDDILFEDVAAPVLPSEDAPVTSGDLELTLNVDTRVSLTNPFGLKKGASKRERQVRRATHCLHVLTLMWHNAVRNTWLCDAEVQATMLSHLTPRLWEEFDRWRRNSALDYERPAPEKKKPAKRQDGTKKTKEKSTKAKERLSKDWGDAAERLEEGVVDMSHGDPLFRFMQSLQAWWKQRFKVTKPGLRKWGYMSLERLDRLTKAYKSEPHDPQCFGERFLSIDDFRQCVRSCRGSRDVGAQLFIALLRGLGLDVRMVANLQSLGFGWNKYEDADAEKDEGATPKKSTSLRSSPTREVGATSKSEAPPGKVTKPKSQRKSVLGSKNEDSVADSEDLEVEYKDTDDESVVEVEAAPRKPTVKLGQLDKDLEFPHYWAEILSPVTETYLPVDAITKGIIATNRELVESLEPRGAKADKARQLIAYIVGYSSDGTAKDITVRYLKRQMLPGKTKGVRMPVEKIPVYNRHGKVKRYEQYDWFATAMSGYQRGGSKCPVTAIDTAEDATDLKPAQPEKKEVKEGEETLQYYKQSKEFALERHLRREEALKPTAKPVKVFNNNKGKAGKTDEEDVYLRADVLAVKSAETWHKQGRAPKPGEEPLKRAPYRAATTNRRREILEAEMATGQKVLQGLYSRDQTQWIIPPPIKDGVIPKNSYGNIDLFAEHMCPEGAVHIPYRAAIRVCKRLEIDYAEAVVDFEFGNRMAVPVIRGVVIAEEHYEHVMEEVEKDEAERIRKEDEKRRKATLGRWRKFLMGMRIVERIRQDYGHVDDTKSVFAHTQDEAPDETVDEDMGGGFLPEGFVEDKEDDEPTHRVSSFFPVADEEDENEDDGLIMEDGLPQVADGGHTEVAHGSKHGLISEQDLSPEGSGEMEPEALVKTEKMASRTRPSRTSNAIRSAAASRKQPTRQRKVAAAKKNYRDEESGLEDMWLNQDDGDES